MKFLFDFRGYLNHDGILKCSWDDFLEAFISPFPENSTRHLIWNEFEVFLFDAKALVSSTIEIWIDGSFTTLTPNPNDIDIVLLIPFSDINADFKNFVKLHQRKTQSKIDAYVVELFPETHENHVFSETDKKYWLFQFGKTAPNRKKERFSKGIISITI